MDGVLPWRKTVQMKLQRNAMARGFDVDVADTLALGIFELDTNALALGESKGWSKREQHCEQDCAC